MPKRKKNNDDNDSCSGEEDEYIQPGSGGGGRIGRGKAKTGQQKGPGSRSRGGQTSAVASQSMMPITSSTSEIDPSAAAAADLFRAL